MPHVLVSTFYGILQLAISSLFLNFTEFRWYYVVTVLLALCTVYILFMRRFFHLHLQRI
ncbi:MAG: hypothetical protein WCQ87_08175 [Parabacteroides sp.]